MLRPDGRNLEFLVDAQPDGDDGFAAHSARSFGLCLLATDLSSASGPMCRFSGDFERKDHGKRGHDG